MSFKTISNWFDSTWKKCKVFLKGNRVILIFFSIIALVVIGNCFHILDRIWNFPEAYYHDSYLSDPYNMKGRMKVVSDTLNFKEKLTFVAEKREKIFTGLLVLLGIILTAWRSYELFKQNKNSEKRITHEKEENDKQRKLEKAAHDKDSFLQAFTTASELFHKPGDENLAARLSGIYLFEQIMNASEDYHWQIVELFTAYVREKRDNRKFDTDNPLSFSNPNIENLPQSDDNFYTISSIEYRNVFDNRKPIYKRCVIEKKYYCVPIEKDIQAILTVLGRRNRTFEKDSEPEGKNLEQLIIELNNATSDDEINIITNCLGRIPHIDLMNVNLYKANLDKLHFENAMFNNSHFFNNRCLDTRFENTELQGTHFENTSVDNAFFNHAWLKDANFDNSHGLNTKFNYSILNYTSFFTAKLQFSNFTKATCTETNFKNAVLVRGNFDNAILSKVNFSDTNLNQANLIDIDIFSANFTNASLDRSNFTNSSISKGTIFDNSDCTVTNFTDTKNLTAEQLSKSMRVVAPIGLSRQMKDEIIVIKPEWKDYLADDIISF